MLFQASIDLESISFIVYNCFICSMDFLQPIVHAVSDPFYKITSEALLVTQQLVKVIRPLGKQKQEITY